MLNKTNCKTVVRGAAMPDIFEENFLACICMRNLVVLHLGSTLQMSGALQLAD